jgi:hypothetical protein
VSPIHPEKVGVFINNEELGSEPQCEHPLPLGHDWFGGTDDPAKRVVTPGQFPIKTLSALGSGIISHPIDASVNAFGHTGVAGDQIEFQPAAVNPAEQRSQLVQNFSRATLNEKDPSKWRYAAAEEIAQ